MKYSTILKKARKLITEKGHTKGTNARNKYRHAVNANSASAVRFCSFGAVYNILGICKDYVGQQTIEYTVSDVAAYLSRTVPYGTKYYGVVQFNDAKTTTPKDVDLWFKRAITLAKAEGN